MELKDKTVLVTGGASGLGAACAQEFLAAGASVVVADLKENSSQRNDKLIFCETDVTNESSVNRTLDKAFEKFGALHGVINCAGILMPEKILSKEGVSASLDKFSKVVMVNLCGSFNVIRLAVARMAKLPAGANGERGVMINTASIAAFEGQVGQSSYSASKGGIVSMTLPLARELAFFGIRVMTISPGIFETPMMNTLPEKVRDSLGAMVPFPSRLGRPLEFAKLARHIFENEMLNGETIRLDGAMRMGAK